MTLTDNPEGVVPREQIPWYPTISKELCTNCTVCIDFCQRGVYALDDIETKVVAPYNCVVGCSNCESECATNAISFPNIDQFMMILAELRLSYRSQLET